MKYTVPVLLALTFAAFSQAPRDVLEAGEVNALLLPAPPFASEFVKGAMEYVTLQEVSAQTNRVIDLESWFTAHYFPALTYHNGGINDAIRGDYPPQGIDPVIDTGSETLYLYTMIFGSQTVLLSYGSEPNRFGVVLDPRVLVSRDYVTLDLNWALDFSEWAHGPVENVDGSVLFMAVRWAEEVNGILYVSHTHRTYSASSGGLNAYITAFDIEGGQVLWRSRPLVSNSENFLVVGDTIITGYGFTDEDDFIYLLDRVTGEVYDAYPVQTSPDYFVLEGSALYVRCYDADCVFNVRRVDR